MDPLSFDNVIQRPLIPPTENPLGAHFDVCRTNEELAWLVSAMVEFARSAGLNIEECRFVSAAGGYKDLPDETRLGLFSYYANGLGDPNDPASFKGFIRSGGTLEFSGDPMVTQIPAYLARLYQCYAWSTTPKTSRMNLDAQTGKTSMGKRRGAFEHRSHSVAVFDPGVAAKSTWDGDVEAYMLAMSECGKRLGMKSLVIMTNGGDATVTEALAALYFGVPLILVKGSLRATDDMIYSLHTGNFVDYARIHIEKANCFLGDDHLAQIAELDLSQAIYIARVNEAETLREGVKRFFNAP